MIVAFELDLHSVNMHKYTECKDEFKSYCPDTDTGPIDLPGPLK